LYLKFFIFTLPFCFFIFIQTDRFLMAKCYNQRNSKMLRQYVTPAKAGVHFPKNLLDARLRGHDKLYWSV